MKMLSNALLKCTNNILEPNQVILLNKIDTRKYCKGMNVVTNHVVGNINCRTIKYLQ